MAGGGAEEDVAAVDSGQADGGVEREVGDELDADVGERREEDQEGMRRREEVAETAWLWRSGEQREEETAGREEWKWLIRVW